MKKRKPIKKKKTTVKSPPKLGTSIKLDMKVIEWLDAQIEENINLSRSGIINDTLLKKAAAWKKKQKALAKAAEVPEPTV